MPELSDGPNSFKDPLTSRGGADALPGTPDVTGHGAEVEGKERGGSTARVPAGRGLGIVGWVVLAIAVVLFIAYIAGLF